MRLIDMFMSGHKHLANKKTKTIQWSIHSPIQLLIGNNGFGKSTLLDEYSPLPPAKKKFNKGGMKKQTVEHKNKRYILTADFSKKHTYSFFDIEENKELNLGGTITIQFDLVRDILGYTPEIHQILKGKKKLTTMSTKERKDFFSKMSDVSIDYAMNVYDSLRTEMRNLLGVKKYNKKKIVEETAKLIDKEKRETYKAKVNELSSLIAELSRSRFHDAKTGEVINLDREIMLVRNCALNIVNEDMIYIGYENEEEVLIALTKKENELNNLEGKKKDLLQQVDELKQTMDTVREIKNYPSEDIQRDLDALVSQVPKVENTLGVNFRSSSSHYLSLVVSKIEEIRLPLFDAISHLAPNKEGKLHRQEYYSKLEHHKQTLYSANAKAHEEFNSNALRIKFIEQHQKEECPNCKHQFVPGSDDLELPTLKSLNEKLSDKIRKYEESLKKLEILIEEATEYRTTLNDVTVLLDNYVFSDIKIKDKYIKEFFLSDYYLTDNTIELKKTLNETFMFIKYYYDKMRNVEKINELKYILETREKLGISDDDLNIDKKIDRLNNEIHQLIQKEKLLYKERNSIDVLRQQVVYINETEKELLEAIDKINIKLIEQYKDTVNEEIDVLLLDTQTQLNDISKQLAASSISEGIIQHLNETIEQIEFDEKLYEKMLVALGPQKGLIGKSIIGFTNSFIDKMNDVLKAIWTTPLTINSMSVDKKGFSYKFGVRTYDDAEATEDVCETSDGEAEIIDFAFMLITVSCLELTDYPLLLDETGKFFKLEHKIRLYDYIKLLVEYEKASQVVIVSHFKGTYEALTRADVCRIDPTGLEIEDHENKNFIINGK